MVAVKEFFKAVSLGDEDIVRRAISEEFDLNTISPGSGGTALNIASRIGNVSVCKILINNDANLEARTNNGMTPLLSAIVGVAASKKDKKPDYLAIIEMLLIAGAEPTYINRKGEKEFAYLSTEGLARRQIRDIFVKLGIVEKSKAEMEAQKHAPSIQAVTEVPAIQESPSLKKPYLPQPSFLETVTSMFFGPPKGESKESRPLIKSGQSGPKLKQE